MKRIFNVILIFLLTSTISLLPGCHFQPNLSQELIAAIKTNDFDTFEELLAQNPNLDLKPYLFDLDRQNMPPLHYACLEGKIDFVYRLIEAGANVNNTNYSNKSTPLMVTLQYARKNKFEIARFLVESGADVTISAYKWTALNYVFLTPLSDKEEAYDFAMLLIEKGAKIDVGARGHVIFDAVKADNLLMVKYLIEERNVDVNLQDKSDGYTLLIQAVEYGNINIVEYLLDKGADIIKTDIEGKTAIDIAKEKGFEEILELLNH